MAAQFSVQRRVPSEFAAEREAPDRPVAPRQFAIDAAQCLAIEAGHRTELHVHVKIDAPGFAFGVGLLARYGGLEEAAAVEHISAQSAFLDAAGAALGLRG